MIFKFAQMHPLSQALFAHYYPFPTFHHYGREFGNTLLKEVCKLYNIKVSIPSVGHPHSNGLLECSHLTLLEIIEIFKTKHPNEYLLNVFSFAFMSHNNCNNLL